MECDFPFALRYQNLIALFVCLQFVRSFFIFFASLLTSISDFAFVKKFGHNKFTLITLALTFVLAMTTRWNPLLMPMSVAINTHLINITNDQQQITFFSSSVCVSLSVCVFFFCFLYNSHFHDNLHIKISGFFLYGHWALNVHVACSFHSDGVHNKEWHDISIAGIKNRNILLCCFDVARECEGERTREGEKKKQLTLGRLTGFCLVPQSSGVRCIVGYLQNMFRSILFSLQSACMQ